MAEKKDFIIKPGIGVDLVFDLDSLSPKSRPTIVFDCDDKKRLVIVAQPAMRLKADKTKKQQMHISSLIHGELSSKVRLGYACRILKTIDNYKLANKGQADAVLIEYIPPLIEVNIRAAYRFHPNNSHNVLGKLLYNDVIYYSGQHFKFHNISINGIGLLIPKKISKIRNPLADIHTHSQGKIGIILKDSEEEEIIYTIDCEFMVVRANANYNEKSAFAGCTLINVKPDYEELLNKFIHKAQLHEIRKLNRLL